VERKIEEGKVGQNEVKQSKYNTEKARTCQGEKGRVK
jgi:hypothetical protein